MEAGITNSILATAADVEFATVEIGLIDIGEDRARTDFGDIKELALSIKEVGLIQPLAVCLQEGNRPYLLLAGERRLRAKSYNGDKTTQVRIFPRNLSKLELRTIELHENFYRKDFTWLELIKAQKEIHELQQSIHGKKVSTLPDATGWTAADTAALVNRSKASVTKDIQLATAVEQFPDLFTGCKNKQEASKMMNKISETLLRDELAQRVSVGKGSDSLRRLSNSYVVTDFFKAAAEMENGIFNFIEIDPPYAIDLTAVKRQEEANTQYTLKEYNEIPVEEYPDFMQRLLKESFRLATEHAWMIVWFGPEPWFEQMYNWITDVGWKTTRMTGVWTKGHGQSLNPNTRLASSFESFFYCWKGAPGLARPGAINEFRFPPVPPQQKIHPTQRPLDLMSALYSTFAFEGSRVLIPCAGSGVGILAANECKMSAVATDITPVYKDAYLLMLNEYLQSGD